METQVRRGQRGLVAARTPSSSTAPKHPGLHTRRPDSPPGHTHSTCRPGSMRPRRSIMRALSTLCSCCPQMVSV